MPIVSIIMPAYNSGQFITESIESILSQTMKDWELLVIDDCSVDATIEVVRRFAENDSRIRLLSTKENSGSGIARNIGIKEANGRYIAFCDSDDWWYPDKLALQIQFMEKNGYEFVCSYYEDAKIDLTPYYVVTPPAKQNFKDMTSGCIVGTPGVIYDTARIGKIYMPEYRRSQDWGTWMRILRQVDFLYVFPRALWRYRHNPQSMSNNKIKMVKAAISIYRNELGYSKIKSWWVFLTVFLPKNIGKKIRKIF